MTNAERSASSRPHKHRDVDFEVRRPPDVDVLIVGSGFSGICLGARLGQAGIESFLIIDKAGGTRRDNRYPGCACDIPSHLYSLSFAPRSDWHRVYPSQPGRWRYLRDVADRFGLRQLKPTVWQSGGYRSWYQDRAGYNVAIWQGLTVTYRWQTCSAKRTDFGTVVA
jgi:cation diffusion facilitator CzcD-associated flavoprotein CzcO